MISRFRWVALGFSAAVMASAAAQDQAPLPVPGRQGEPMLAPIAPYPAAMVGAPAQGQAPLPVPGRPGQPMLAAPVLQDQLDALDTAQKLRAKAQDAGNLRSSPQQTVVQQE